MEKSKDCTIRILVNDSLYRMQTFGETSNIMLWMDGETTVGSDAKTLGVEHIPQCCVFSHVLDMLAYIDLHRRKDMICHDYSPTNYLVIKPSCNYSLVYELLKQYNEVHGYLRVNSASVIANNILGNLLDTYRDESSRYKKEESLVSYCMKSYQYIEL